MAPPAKEAPAERDLLSSARDRLAALGIPEPTPEQAGIGLGAGAGLLVLLALLRRLAGRGDLAVVIELPPDRRGSFSVRLTRYRERRRPRPDALEPEARASTRNEHFMVARETHFRGVRARSWWVVLEGVVEAGDGGQREAVLDEREVRIERGRTARAVFDLRPRECHLEVRLLRDGRPLRDGRVALERDPTSLRIARDGVVRIGLGLGAYQLLAGGEGRALVHSIEIRELRPQQLTLELDDAADLAFRDCDAAVDPFLRGDLSVAAAALERAGQREAGDLMAARFHQRQGSVDTAASRFEAAGRFVEAAELWAEGGALDKAAALFERGGDPGRAALLWQEAGEPLRAGLAFEAAGDLAGAVACYRAAGDGERLLDALEKKGDAFEAGELALERGETSRAARSLQQVDARDARYTTACRLLADLFSEQEKFELAVQKADEAISFSRPEDTSSATVLWYGALLERAGRPERALRVFEELLARDPAHGELQPRVEALRRQVSAARREGTAPPRGPSAFGEGSRYELLEEIGCGGMGVVYRARDRRLGREVALKRLPDAVKENPRAVDLFMREARAAAALNHPNIVTLHDVDEEDGLFFITMELLRGTTLAEVVRRRGRVSPVDTARLGLQIAAGLGYAHARKIVHRDVKTANLFFTQDRVVKIMDFGLAKMLEEVRRGTTVVGGTPYYMAPEQAAGEAVDHRADLYAFGVTLFELATGRRPFEEGDVAYQHRHTPPPDPRAFVAELPERLAALVLGLLAKRPEERPESAEAVGQQLQTLLAEAGRKPGG